MTNRPLIVLALLWGCRVASLDAQTLPSVDTERMMRELTILAHDSMAGRATGTPGARRARAFLTTALAESGLTSSDESPLSPFTWSGGRGVNVIASVPGHGDPEGDVIVLTAHYDHAGIRDGEVYNGADDNASGVVALLEIGRRLLARPLVHPVILAFVDGEEAGLLGSRAFVEHPPVPLRRIALDVNLDMVSRTDGLLWAAGASHTPELRPILEEVAERAPVELRLGHDRPGAAEGQDWSESSDHASFGRAGIPWVYFGVEDHVDYHRPTDDVERIDPAELTASVQTILMALRVLDAALPLEKATAR